jgi:hypothetical protein
MLRFRTALPTIPLLAVLLAGCADSAPLPTALDAPTPLLSAEPILDQYMDAVITSSDLAGGVVTQGPAHRVGSPVALVVFDNGTSAHDPPDQVSPVFIGFSGTCADADPTLAWPLWDVSPGQVTVW